MASDHSPTIGLDTSALDPQFKEHAQRGIGRYVSNLARYFGHEGNATRVRVRPFDHRSARMYGPRILRAAHAMIDWLPAGRTTLRQQVVFPIQLRYARSQLVAGNPECGSAGSGRFDLLHFPAHMDAPAWGLRGYILTVLDLIPLVCADLYKAQHSGPRFRFARWLEMQAIKNARLILAISDNTARDVQRILGVAAERIVVTPLGVNDEFLRPAVLREDAKQDLLRRLGLIERGVQERPLILYVGGIDPRKNYKGTLNVFCAVLQECARRRLAPPVLLMIGNISKDKEYPRLLAHIERLGIGKDVILPGYVSDMDLGMLYQSAALFLFLSLYEGFGLPPLEAMAAGLPVVSSNTSSMREVLGEAGLLVDPNDVQQAAAAVLEVLSRKELAETLRERGRRQAALFTWEKTGKRTEEGYEQACANI